MLNTRWIGDNLFCQANDSKEALNRRQPIDRWNSYAKQALNGKQPIIFFSTFLLLSWDDLTNQFLFFFCCFSFKYYLIKNYFFCITYTTFPFMLKIVLVLAIHSKHFRWRLVYTYIQEQFPSSATRGKFLGLASEDSYRITYSFPNSTTGDIPSQIFPYPF